MRFSTSSIIAAPLLAAASVAAQQSITVNVGAGGSLAYDPPAVTANVGDVVTFQFQAKNHTVTQSTFASPCLSLEEPAPGFDSGFMPVAADLTTPPPSVSFTVNVTTPLWFYCKQTGHCEKGMVFAINPTADKSFAAFQAAANASNPADGTPGSASASSSAPARARRGPAVVGARGWALALDAMRVMGIEGHCTDGLIA
ncbi:Cupredoxin [Auriscalpium vulgare]|uniref:Cupredoxin n=1 Tax=Auriscalpium vulgare TaxID=40419 RepID=A0ACB8R7N1_9AGAM|nr:Cupredoxin [Auriscalpium vulgare]